MSAREAAYLAVVNYLKSGTYLDETLTPLAVKELSQARHIAYGTVQRLLSLDNLARQLTTRTSLNLKPKEKAILFTALYQAHFQQGSPLYAITDESLKLAKKYCHTTFVSFLNALLRAYGNQPPTLPAGDSAADLSIRFSYPLWFVNQLLKERDLQTTQAILELGNQPSHPMARCRPPADPFKMVSVSDVSSVGTSKDYYIQNATPVKLIQNLTKSECHPGRILDLCAAPGGKLILAHDLFPDASLFANDISEKRLRLLRQNLDKYQISAELSCRSAEGYTASEPFDLIILDVPCSNTGVLGKRPEARWRLSQNFLDDLIKLQRNLIASARRLLAPNGVIWYLTCSILNSENEDLVKDFSNPSMTQLPNAEGRDGGFGCAIRGHSL